MLFRFIVSGMSFWRIFGLRWWCGRLSWLLSVVFFLSVFIRVLVEVILLRIFRGGLLLFLNLRMKSFMGILILSGLSGCRSCVVFVVLVVIVLFLIRVIF